MINYFELANEEFLKERDENRVAAILKANCRLKGILELHHEINEMLKKAENGDFTELVETFISHQMAIKHESKKIFSKF